MSGDVSYALEVTEGYVTSEGDTVDYIVWKQYGTQSGRIMERFLEANPGLAAMGAVLLSGIRLNTPKLETATANKGVSLWR